MRKLRRTAVSDTIMFPVTHLILHCLIDFAIELNMFLDTAGFYNSLTKMSWEVKYNFLCIFWFAVSF